MSTLRKFSIAAAIAKQHALGCRPAGGDHDRHRCGKAERAGAGNDQHGHCVDDSVNPARVGPPESPDQKGEHSGTHDHHDEISGNTIRQALHRCPRPLGLHHHLDDAGEHRLRTDALRAHDQRPAGVERGTDQWVPGALRDGQRLAGKHGFVDGARALDDEAIDGNFLARPNPQRIAHLDLCNGHVRLGTVGMDAPRGLGVSPSSDLIAALVCERAFSSRVWPSRVSEMITAAASK